MMIYHDHLFPRLIEAGYRTQPIVGESIVDYWAERVPGRPARSFGVVDFPAHPDLAEPIGERLRLYAVCIGEMRDLLEVLDDLEQAVAALR